jgi:hypothetical protein
MPAANDATMDAHAATRGRIAMGAAMSGPGIARQCDPGAEAPLELPPAAWRPAPIGAISAPHARRREIAFSRGIASQSTGGPESQAPM